MQPRKNRNPKTKTKIKIERSGRTKKEHPQMKLPPRKKSDSQPRKRKGNLKSKKKVVRKRGMRGTKMYPSRKPEPRKHFASPKRDPNILGMLLILDGLLGWTRGLRMDWILRMGLQMMQRRRRRKLRRVRARTKRCVLS